MSKNNGSKAIETLPSPEELAKQGFESLSRPGMFKLRDLPVNGVIDGVLKEIKPSTNPAIRQPLLEMVLTKDGSTVLVPCQAGIATRIFDKDTGKCAFVGKRILITKTGYKKSNKYKDESGQGREFATYDVIVSKK